MFSFENLRVYRDSLNFSKSIYKLTKAFPKQETFGITSQLRRAASSVALNIAERSALTKSEFRNFLRRARGSLYECIPILAMALDNKYISGEEYESIYENCDVLARSLSALINSMK